jgi:PAS domain S-box-containing protein
MSTRPRPTRSQAGSSAKPDARSVRAASGQADAPHHAGTAEALRLSEARLRAVLETAVDAVITIDERGRIQSVNPATLRMFGYSVSELIGQNVSILMPSPYREEHDGYLARYMRTGEKRIIGIGREVEARRKDGTVFSVDLAVSEVEPGKLFTGMIRDISDRKLAESRLREADRMASIGTLAAGLGHDMNNVLLPVRAHLNAASALAALPAVRDHLKSVQKSIDYLQQLADGLHFLAMDPESVDDAGGVTDLRAWWSQAGAVLSKAVPKHVKVAVSLPDGLPEVAVAAHALTQAVLNLIVNAGEAIPAGRKRRQGNVRLWARPEPDGSAVKLGVADNGTGMTEEVKRRAFDMFFTTKPRGLGTGLGLAMVRKVIDRARGSIEIDSTPGKGTTVVLVLPTAHRAGDHPEMSASVHISDGRAASMVRHLLEMSGVQVTNVEPAHALIRVIEPTQANLSDTKTWRARHPQRRLVLFGSPDARDSAAWRALDPLMVENTGDFEALRTALGLALEQD